MRIVPPNDQTLPVNLDRPLKRHIPRALHALSDVVEAMRNMPQPMRRGFEGGIRRVRRVAVEQLLRVQRALQHAPEHFANAALQWADGSRVSFFLFKKERKEVRKARNLFLGWDGMGWRWGKHTRQ